MHENRGFITSLYTASPLVRRRALNTTLFDYSALNCFLETFILYFLSVLFLFILQHPELFHVKSVQTKNVINLEYCNG